MTDDDIERQLVELEPGVPDKLNGVPTVRLSREANRTSMWVGVYEDRPGIHCAWRVDGVVPWPTD